MSKWNTSTIAAEFAANDLLDLEADLCISLKITRKEFRLNHSIAFDSW